MVFSASAASQERSGDASANDSITHGGSFATTALRRVRARPKPIPGTHPTHPKLPPVPADPAGACASSRAGPGRATALGANAAGRNLEDHPGLRLRDAQWLGSLLARPGEYRRPNT